MGGSYSVFVLALVAALVLGFFVRKAGFIAKLIFSLVFIALAIGMVMFFVKVGWGGWLQ